MRWKYSWNDFLFKKNYSTNNKQQARVDDIPQDGCSVSVEEMSNRLKTYSKSITEVENTTLKNKVLLEEWLSTAFKVYRHNRCVEKRYQIDLKIGFKENVV